MHGTGMSIVRQQRIETDDLCNHQTTSLNVLIEHVLRLTLELDCNKSGC